MLNTIITEAKQRLKPVHVAFLDVAKAFDSLSHWAILRSLRRLGVPEPLVSYVEKTYSSTFTRLRVGGVCGPLVKCGRGVRQGDPLSAILFNCVIDEVLSKTEPCIGYQLDEGANTNGLAFADDLATVASTREGQQALLDSVSGELGSSGLDLNPAKCATLSIEIDGKAKRWVVNPNAQFTVGGRVIKALSVEESYK